MRDILTVTLNPAVDLATSVAQVVPGPKLRCRPPRIDPGGGGVNVARAISKMGGVSTAMVVVGGATGEQLLELLSVENISILPVPVEGATRQSFAVTDESTGEQYRFSTPGEALSHADGAYILNQIARTAPKDGIVVFSGSVTPGLDVAFPSEILDRISGRTNRLIVDTSGPALDQLVRAPVSPLYLLRIDRKEAEEAAGGPLPDLQSSIDFATQLIDRGVAEIIVTGRGPDGSILVTKDRRIFCHAPNVAVASKIGAGDAFVGALTLSLARDEPLETALQWGVAAASATVCTEGTALCTLEAVRNLLPQCVIETH